MGHGISELNWEIYCEKLNKGSWITERKKMEAGKWGEEEEEGEARKARLCKSFDTWVEKKKEWGWKRKKGGSERNRRISSVGSCCRLCCCCCWCCCYSCSGFKTQKGGGRWRRSFLILRFQQFPLPKMRALFWMRWKERKDCFQLRQAHLNLKTIPLT